MSGASNSQQRQGAGGLRSVCVQSLDVNRRCTIIERLSGSHCNQPQKDCAGERRLTCVCRFKDFAKDLL